MLAKFDFLLPSIYFAVLSALGTAFFLLKPEDKEVSLKSFIIYSLAIMLPFGLLGLTGLKDIETAKAIYMLLQAVFLIAGILHVFVLYKFTSWADRNSFLYEFIFTVYLAVLGAFSFLVVFSFLNKQGYALIFTSSALFFLVPFLVSKSFDLMLSVDEEVYPKWYFPVGASDIDIPDEMMDEANIIVVEFRMKKNTSEDSEEVHSRSKLPTKMELGKFFPVFLEQYNDRNPGNRIEYLDEAKQPYGWNFYLQPKWYQKPTFLNPDLTIRENEVNENDIIIAERV